MVRITVIIPTYNRLERLRGALRSALAQTGVSQEVLVVDDGSTDGTRDMIAKEFPEVRYFYQNNQGPSAARNLGIKNAAGEWLAFLDSDDVWLPGKLCAQLDFFAANPDHKICQTEEIWIRNGKRVNPMKKHQKHGGRIFEKCLPLCIVSPSAVMIHRGLFDEVGLFDESLPACEDYDLWLRIAAKHPVGLIEKPYLTRYGGHEDQRSREFPAMDRFRIYALKKILSSGILTAEQTAAAEKMLEEKTNIFMKGLEKRSSSPSASRLLAFELPKAVIGDSIKMGFPLSRE